ncbi:MAG: HSP90 family protein, partial [Planctomycetota bacterium]
RQIHDKTWSGQIHIELLGEGSNRTLVVEDNGIGLTESEVHEFLATIGQSSKSGELSREDFLGQFGIGLLSGFVVSDEITVITKSMHADSPPIEWKGNANGTYSIRNLETEFSVGTRVYLRPKENMGSFFEMDMVESLLRHFGHHLPIPIQLKSHDREVEINEEPPWRIQFAGQRERREAILDYGREVFEIDFLDAIPLTSSLGQVEGVAYVLPFAASPGARQQHRVYLKNMLLAETVEGLLPDWAFFVKCVVNASQLRPNAARESFFEDETLRGARQEMGDCLRGYLVDLAENDRSRLDKIIQLHYMPIKSLAIEDSEFYRLFVDWLPFETSIGQTTLGEHCRHQSTIRYVRDVDQFRQIASVAGAQNLCVFNGGYSYDTELLERLSEEFPDRTVERVDANDLVQDFEELTIEESEKVFELVKLADTVLQKYKCAAEMRKFAPVDLPTIFTANQSATFLRSVDQSMEQADELWSGILENVAQSSAAAGYAQLVMNYRNALIQKLTSIDDRELLAKIIEILYLQSLLLGHYPLSSQERTILGNGLLGLIDHFISESNNDT